MPTFLAKVLFTATFAVLIIQTANGQLNLRAFKTFALGTTFQDTSAKSKIIGLFKQENKEYSEQKGDFLNTYRIIFEKAPFDYFGQAEYIFQYVKDTLASVEISYDFSEHDISKFERFISQLYEDANNMFQKKDYSKNVKFNIDSIKIIVENDCKENVINDVRTLGLGLWLINDKNIYINVGTATGGYYKGTWVEVKIILTSVSTYNLFLLNEKRGSGYEIIDVFRNNKLTPYKPYTGDPYVEFHKNRIQLKDENGTYKVPVNLNGILTLDFVLDLGAADVSVSPDVFLVLVKSGTISNDDYIGSETYQFADGTTAKSDVINLKTITIGGKTLENVRASVSKSINAPLLLGQSAMKKLNNYKIDVENKVLIIE